MIAIYIYAKNLLLTEQDLFSKKPLHAKINENNKISV